jgi:chromatin remodeling complex protein RSC6
MASASSSSRLEALWEDHERCTRRIEELERRLDENARRKRRRIANLLDEVPVHRRSHLRVFLTHNKNFTLCIEGKLLIGHLDHLSATAFDENAGAEGRSIHEDDDALARSSDRVPYRGKDQNEGDVPVEKIMFTHFFDKLHVNMQTVFQKPIVKEQLSAPKKTSRSKSKTKAIMDASSLETSFAKEYTWTRDMTGDASAWFVKYTPSTPPEGQELHSVVSIVKLWPRPAHEKLFKPSDALATHLFPEHAPVPPKKKKGKKKSTEEEEEDIPLDNNIVIPPSLTMKEIIMALFHYIQEKNLTDADEPSVIVNDQVLTSLFQCDRMNFADVQQLLLTKQLVIDVTREPIVLTYIMTKDSSSPALGEAAPEHIPQVLSFDTDVYVEGVFHYRVRELLRRIKKREFEYTSCRTRARNILTAARANPDVVNRKIEDAVVGRGYTLEHVPVWLALAKSAPPNSEARAAAHMDAKICSLLDRLQHHTKAAKAAWDVVDACRGEQSK